MELGLLSFVGCLILPNSILREDSKDMLDSDLSFIALLNLTKSVFLSVKQSIQIVGLFGFN